MGGRLDLINQTSSPQLSPLALVTWYHGLELQSLPLYHLFSLTSPLSMGGKMQNVKSLYKSLLLLECFSFVGFEDENG